MKKIFLMIASTSLLISCDDSDKPVAQINTTNTYYGNGAHRKCVTEMTHNGCQYIGSFNGYSSDWGTHSGTCNNPIHNQNKSTK